MVTEPGIEEYVIWVLSVCVCVCFTASRSVDQQEKMWGLEFHSL